MLDNKRSEAKIRGTDQRDRSLIFPQVIPEDIARKRGYVL